MREIRFYRSPSGRSPVEELERVPEQYFKKLTGTDGLWEVRAQHGGDTFRLLGFFDGPRLVVLVSGFAKKSERTPRREIVLAEERRREYSSRGGRNE